MWIGSCRTRRPSGGPKFYEVSIEFYDTDRIPEHVFRRMESTKKGFDIIWFQVDEPMMSEV